jgi:hypothetical protein
LTTPATFALFSCDSVSSVIRSIGVGLPTPAGIGDVARDDGHPDAGGEQFGFQVGRARCRLTAPAEQNQVLDAGLRQPAGDVPAKRAGAAGDQRGPARRPRRAAAGRLGPDQPPDVHRGIAYGDLVLAVGVAKHGEQRAPVTRAGQIDKAAPALRVFQSDDPAESPDRGLRGIAPVVGEHVKRAAGDQPQRRTDPGVAERLRERDRRGESLRGLRTSGDTIVHSGQ